MIEDLLSLGFVEYRPNCYMKFIENKRPNNEGDCNIFIDVNFKLIKFVKIDKNIGTIKRVSLEKLLENKDLEHSGALDYYNANLKDYKLRKWI